LPKLDHTYKGRAQEAREIMSIRRDAVVKYRHLLWKSRDQPNLETRLKKYNEWASKL
jgi:hypothetical protein